MKTKVLYGKLDKQQGYVILQIINKENGKMSKRKTNTKHLNTNKNI